MKPANKERGEVSAPQFGEDAVLRFTVDSLERLQSSYDKRWLDAVLLGLADTDMAVIKTAVEVSIIGGRQGDDGNLDYSEVRNLGALRSALYDALFLMLYGLTFAEKKAEEERLSAEEMARKLKQIEENPQMAAAFLHQLGLLGTAPASDPMKSDASPQERSETSSETGATIAGN